MAYLTIFLLIRADTTFIECFTDEANASADFLLEKISNQETSANSELTFTIHTNLFITTLSKDLQNGEEPFPHSSPTIVSKSQTLVKTKMKFFHFFGRYLWYRSCIPHLCLPSSGDLFNLRLAFFNFRFAISSCRTVALFVKSIPFM